MTDMFGSPVKKGDKIVYTKLMKTNSGYHGSTHRSPLTTGEIEDIRKAFGKEVAVIGNAYLKSSNILLYDWSKYERKET